MAKIIKNPIEVKLMFYKENNIWDIEPSAHYGVGATEYPQFNHRKGMEIVLTPAQEADIKAFAANVIYPQILANEGV